MWVRGIEVLLASWLMISPVVLDSSDQATWHWPNTLLAIGIIACATLSLSPRWSHAYLVNLYIGIGLILWGRFANLTPPEINQNHVILGFLFLGLGLIPNADESVASTSSRSRGPVTSPITNRWGWLSSLARH